MENAVLSNVGTVSGSLDCISGTVGPNLDATCVVTAIGIDKILPN
jgi:hypothetical protein